MHTTYLRKVGGSIMLALPVALLDQLDLKAGAAVRVALEGRHLVIESTRPKYTIEELLAESYYVEPTEEDRLWTNDPPVGRELI